MKNTGGSLVVLYRDEHFLAIDKPAGLPSVRERWTEDETAFTRVFQWLRTEDPGAPKPRVVHRLDKGTSGVLLFATSLAAARVLSRRFRDREVEKTYLALVAGTPPEDEGRIELLLEEPPGGGRMRVVQRKGKEAITEWTVRERFRGYALLSVRPRTGRTHQIRASLLALGYPLLVDPMYGGRKAFFLSSVKPRYKAKKEQPERPLIDRITLHAARVALAHPITGRRIEIAAEPPRDFELALKYLRRYRPLVTRSR